MNTDPIVEEVRRHHLTYARELDYDPAKILADLRRRSEAHPARMAAYPPRMVQKSTAAADFRDAGCS